MEKTSKAKFVGIFIEKKIRKFEKILISNEEKKFFQKPSHFWIFKNILKKFQSSRINLKIIQRKFTKI